MSRRAGPHSRKPAARKKIARLKIQPSSVKFPVARGRLRNSDECTGLADAQMDAQHRRRNEPAAVPGAAALRSLLRNDEPGHASPLAQMSGAVARLPF